MITTLFQQLPKIYEPMLPAIFGKPIPVEQYADCMNCHMCKPNDAVKDVRTFSEKTKCCTFKPIIPNYLVGAILNDTDNQTKLHDYIKTGQSSRHWATIQQKPSSGLRQYYSGQIWHG